MKHVAAAIMTHNNKVLIAQRKEGSLKGLWELPGGKQEEGETLEECLKREIKEEFSKDITVGKFFAKSIYEYENGTICLHAFEVPCEDDKIPELTSHTEVLWLEKDKLKNYRFCPADITIIEKIINA